MGGATTGLVHLRDRTGNILASWFIANQGLGIRVTPHYHAGRHRVATVQEIGSTLGNAWQAEH